MPKKTPKEFDLNTVVDPTFLRPLKIKELPEVALEIRQEIIKRTLENGGHLSSNLGAVELTIALHRSFDFLNDRLLMDVGHQGYTHKLLTGRKLDKLRQADGISGFLKSSESPYDHYEAGHSSTSLSVAEGLAIARRLQQKSYHDYEIVALIGDSSIMNGLAFEALNNLASHLSDKIIIILNDNGMGISPSVGGFGRYLRRLTGTSAYARTKSWYKRVMGKTRFGRFLLEKTAALKNKVKRLFRPDTVFHSLGFKYLGPVDGHNFRKLDQVLRKAKKAKKSVVVHVNTKKGKGYPEAEKDHKGYFHGLSDPRDGFNHEEYVNIQEVFGKLTSQMLEKHENSILINPAMVVGSYMRGAFKAFPKRCFDVGISEEHALTLASGFALSGLHPIISIYSTFLQRGYDQLNHDLARLNYECTLLIDRAGLVGPDGETHQGIFDEALLYATPNVIITMPSNPLEAHLLFEESMQKHGVFAIRYPKGQFLAAANTPNSSLTFGQWPILHESKNQKIALISFGPIINELSVALGQLNIDVLLVNALYQRPINEAVVRKLLNFETIVIHNAYATADGFNLHASEMLRSFGFKGQLVSLAIENSFIKANSISQQMIQQKIDAKSVILLLQSLVK